MVRVSSGFKMVSKSTDALPSLFIPFWGTSHTRETHFLQPWVSDNVIICTNFVFSGYNQPDVGYPVRCRLPREVPARCRLPRGYNQPDVGYPNLDVGYPILDVGYPLRCWLPSWMSVTPMDVGYPLQCRLPSKMSGTPDVGYPRRCRLPPCVSVTLMWMSVTPMDVGYPLQCRLPSMMSVTL